MNSGSSAPFTRQLSSFREVLKTEKTEVFRNKNKAEETMVWFLKTRSVLWYKNK